MKTVIVGVARIACLFFNGNFRLLRGKVTAEFKLKSDLDVIEGTQLELFIGRSSLILLYRLDDSHDNKKDLGSLCNR